VPDADAPPPADDGDLFADLKKKKKKKKDIPLDLVSGLSWRKGQGGSVRYGGMEDDGVLRI
jgi:hypothetical protein